jgi:hypothetical protein
MMDDSKNIPNPNVYYEYGLMTSLRKHIIPLQKENLELAFNIQSYDTIKYTSKNIGTELDRAIKDAIRITEAKEQDDKKMLLPEKTLLRKLELVGLELGDSDWVLHEAIGDTNFKGFGQYHKHFYVYLGKIDDSSEFQDYLDDLGVVLYRTEKKVEDMENRLSTNKKKKEEIDLEVKKAERERIRPIISPIRMSFNRELQVIESSIADATSKLSLMATIFVGFVIQPGINADAFVSSIEELLSQYTRYKLCCSKDDTISFGDVEVSLASPAH